MTQDADYITNDQYPHQPDQGIGLDQAALTITTSPTSTATVGSLPDLAASSVVISKSTVQWGSTFQASTDIQNLGTGTAPPSTLFFVLTGQSGSLSDAIFLGETALPALASGASQQIDQTLQLPIQLPQGVTLNSVGYARVEVLTNPENDFQESVYTNGGSLSQPFIVREPGNAKSVPTTPAAGTLPSISQLAQKSENAAKAAVAEAQSARLAARLATRPARKLHRKVGKGGLNIAKATVSLGTEITKLPTQIYDKLKSSL
jgi:CARDB